MTVEDETFPFRVYINDGSSLVVWARNAWTASNYILLDDDEWIATVLEVEFNDEQ